MVDKIDSNLKAAGAYEEYDRWVRHNTITGLAAAGTALVTMPLIYPAHALFIDGFSQENLSATSDYFYYMGQTMIGELSAKEYLQAYYGDWIAQVFKGAMPPSPIWFAWLGIPAAIGLAGYFSNPHRSTPNIFGDTRWANEADLIEMSEADKVGSDKNLFVVGKFDKKIIKMGETLSILLLAPPGCQPKGSKVRMYDYSLKPIEEITVGDKVLSPNQDGSLSQTSVIKTLKYENRKIFKIETKDESYRCSDNHQVTVVKIVNGKQIWMEEIASRLHETNNNSVFLPVVRADGATLLKRFSITPDGKETVYGFELNGGTQRYLTEEQNIITHNTGKSVGFIVPSTVAMDEASLFLHDQKPELFDMTSGHRSTLGPVYQLKWSAQDKPDGMWITEDQLLLTSPELLETNEDGEYVTNDDGEYKTKPIFYPSWNVISPKCIPAAGPTRDMYIERIVNVLCPDPPTGKDFWVSKARSALIGLVAFLVAKVESAQDSILGHNWDGIPEQWQGKEASFPMLVDWFAHAQNEVDEGSDDPVRDMMRACIEEAKLIDKLYGDQYGVYPMNRAIVEMTNLAAAPDKTRGSILTTMDEALNPFKNESVRQRTSSCDFAFNDLRGKPTPEAYEREQIKVQNAKKEGKIYKPRYSKDEFLPVSIYISVNAEDAKAFATITGIFVDAANSYLVANGPNVIDDQGNQLGPYPFGFLLDEMPQLPKLDTVVNGPSVGRSKKVFYILVGQDFGQIEQKYSRPDVEVLKSTTAIKIILSQNNPTTAEEISKMAGKMTFKQYNSSEKDGHTNPVEKFFSIFAKKKSYSESWSSTEFLKPNFIMSMPKNKHVVMVQDFMSKPILADTPKFWLEPEIAGKVLNLRSGEGPRPCPPMPLYEVAASVGEKEAQSNKQQELKNMKEVIADNKCVIITTPKDLQSLLEGNLKKTVPLGNQFAAAEVEILNDNGYIDIPDIEEMLITDDVAKLAKFCENRKYYIWNKENLNTEINSKLKDAGEKPLVPEFAVFIDEKTIETNHAPGENIYDLGATGWVCLDIPEDEEDITPEFSIHWALDLIAFIVSLKNQIDTLDYASDEANENEESENDEEAA